MQRSRCIAHPASIETHIDDRLLHFRQAPAVARVEQETPLGTASVLTEITLGAAGRFAAFDDLVTLTVRAADGDERHGPFLPMRSYEDEAQCDIYLSPSPLLKHYLLRITTMFLKALASVGQTTASGYCSYAFPAGKLDSGQCEVGPQPGLHDRAAPGLLPSVVRQISQTGVPARALLVFEGWRVLPQAVYSLSPAHEFDDS